MAKPLSNAGLLLFESAHNPLVIMPACSTVCSNSTTACTFAKKSVHERNHATQSLMRVAKLIRVALLGTERLDHANEHCAATVQRGAMQH